VLGSDYSFPPADLDPVGTVRKAGFSEVETAKILDYNARELMPALRAQYLPEGEVGERSEPGGETGRDR